MTNKKKQSSNSSKAKKQAAVKEAEAKQQKQLESEAPPVEASGKSVFTPPQLTAVIFLALGISKLLEWKRALNEVVTQQQQQQQETEASNANGTASTTGLCQQYLLTNDEVDYSTICTSPVTATLMTLKFDLSLQILAMVAFLMLKCWYHETRLDRLNACLTIAPVSTTLLLLQVCRPFLNPSKTRSLLLMCITLTAVAASATSQFVRDLFRGTVSTATSRRTFQSVCLASMAFLQCYEMFQWWSTTSSSGTSPMSVLALSSWSGNNNENQWNDAWKVFMYTIMMDKLTVAVLCAFAWWGLENYQQRSFLLFVSMIKGLEYSMQLSEYDEHAFTDLPAIQTTALACSVLSGVAWIAPF